MLLVCSCAGAATATSESKARLERIGSLELRNARDVAFSGKLAWVACNFQGLALVDISDPRRPVLRKAFPPEMVQALDVQVAAPNQLLVADRFRGLLLFDISKPDEPKRLSALAVPGIATHLDTYREQERIYAAVACGGSGVVTVDITEPRAPKLCGRYTLDVDYMKSIRMAGSAAFVADNRYGGLKILDLSRPQDPQLLLKIQMAGFCDAVWLDKQLLVASYRLAGTRLFRVTPAARTADRESTPTVTYLCTIQRSRDYVRNVLTTGDHLLAANDASLDLYDMSDPTRPVLVDEYRTPSPAMACAEYDGHLYVPCWDGGLLIFKLHERKETKQ